MTYTVQQSIINDTYGTYKRAEKLEVKTHIADIELIAEELFYILSSQLKAVAKERKARLQYIEFSNDESKYCALSSEHGAIKVQELN